MKKVGFLHKPRLHYENSSGKKNLGNKILPFGLQLCFTTALGVQKSYLKN